MQYQSIYANQLKIYIKMLCKIKENIQNKE